MDVNLEMASVMPLSMHLDGSRPDSLRRATPPFGSSTIAAFSSGLSALKYNGGVSAGVIAVRLMSVDQALELADAAMYREKRQRNQIKLRGA